MYIILHFPKIAVNASISGQGSNRFGSKYNHYIDWTRRARSMCKFATEIGGVVSNNRKGEPLPLHITISCPYLFSSNGYSRRSGFQVLIEVTRRRGCNHLNKALYLSLFHAQRREKEDNAIKWQHLVLLSFFGFAFAFSNAGTAIKFTLGPLFGKSSFRLAIHADI